LNLLPSAKWTMCTDRRLPPRAGLSASNAEGVWSAWGPNPTGEVRINVVRIASGQVLRLIHGVGDAMKEVSPDSRERGRSGGPPSALAPVVGDGRMSGFLTDPFLRGKGDPSQRCVIDEAEVRLRRLHWGRNIAFSFPCQTCFPRGTSDRKAGDILVPSAGKMPIDGDERFSR